jgi:hypothetical protein
VSTFIDAILSCSGDGGLEKRMVGSEEVASVTLEVLPRQRARALSAVESVAL